MNGIQGYNSQKQNVNKLFVAYGNDVVDLENQTGYSLNLNSDNKVEFKTFLDRVFLQNYDITPATYNPKINKWTKDYVQKSMISRYLQPYKSRMYLGNCKFQSTGPLDENNDPILFPSRVFFSDFFVGGNLTWGIEWGQNGKIIGGSNMFTLQNPVTQNFKLSGIKIGDPLFITRSSSNDPVLRQKPYLVSKVEEKVLYFTEQFPITDSDIHYWVGSNWFDVETDDNDEITGITKNATNLLVSKNDSFWFYNTAQLKQVNDSPGTSSSRSLINKGGYTYYFRGSSPKSSGIYRYDGVASVDITRGLDKYIKGIDPASYKDVVAWEEGDEIRFFVGDIKNTDYNIDIKNAVITLHTSANTYDVSPVLDKIVCSTTWRQTNSLESYCGSSEGIVLQMNESNGQRGNPFKFSVETGVYYPSGVDVINDFTRIQIIGKNIKGLKIGYKLWNNPSRVDLNYQGIGECKDDLTELVIPLTHNSASGISLEFLEMSNERNDWLIEKIVGFYLPKIRRRYESGK